ncbi:MAG: FAD-dependent oxidoreductase [bacterium]|nr:FAD-dependent oxidoreductase [bacterium]
MNDNIYDVIVIGGGPAGLSAGQYAARANLRTIMLDKSAGASALAYSSKVENYPGLTESLSGSELLDLFRKQAIGFGAEYENDQVVGVRLESDPKEVVGSDRVYRGKTVIVATGSMGRKPTIPGEEEFLGKGVSYCAVCDGAFFRDRVVSVVGDSEEAVKEAGVLARFAKKVYLITPMKELKALHDHPPLAGEKIEILVGHKLVAIEGADLVARIQLKETATGTVHALPIDGVFLYLVGSRPAVDFLGNALDLDEAACVMAHTTMETSIPGVFAAGDVTCAAVRQVVIAAASGCVAALSAEKYIHHRKRSKVDWTKK